MIWTKLRSVSYSALGSGGGIDQFVVLVYRQDAMRRQAFTVKGPATRTFFLSSYGLS